MKKVAYILFGMMVPILLAAVSVPDTAKDMWVSLNMQGHKVYQVLEMYFQDTDGSNTLKVTAPSALSDDNVVFPLTDESPAQHKCFVGVSGTETEWKLLTNDNIGASAAIAGTKIDPDFGSQDIDTTGALAVNSATIAGLSDGVCHVTSGDGTIASSLVVNADINAAAAIAWSKLDKTGSSVDDLDDVDTSTTAPLSGQALVWDGSDFIPGASGDSSFKPRRSDADNICLSKGYYRWNGKMYCTHEGAGTTVDDIDEVCVEISPLTASEGFQLYIDVTGAEDLQVFTQDGENAVECYPIDGLDIHETTTLPSAITPKWQYFHIGSMTSTSGGKVDVVLDQRAEDAASWANIETYNASDWTSFTPTGTWVDDADVDYAGRWRRDGDTMHVAFSVTANNTPATGSTTLEVDLPSGYTIDTAKLTKASREHFGDCTIVGPGTVLYDGAVTAIPSDSDTVRTRYMKKRSASDEIEQAGVTESAPFTWAATHFIVCSYSIPITGWTSQTGNLSTPDNTEVVMLTSDPGNTNCPTGYSDVDVGFDYVRSGFMIDYWDNSEASAKLNKDITRSTRVYDTDTICIKFLTADFDTSDIVYIRAGTGNVSGLPFEEGSFSLDQVGCSSDVNMPGAPTSDQFHYMRMSNTVTVFGSMDADPTAASLVTIYFKPPVLEDFTNQGNASGTMVLEEGSAGRLRAETTNDCLRLDYTPSDALNRKLNFHGSYIIQ